MGLIVLKEPWTKQPPGQARIDYSNPLSKGLVQAIVGPPSQDSGLVKPNGGSLVPTPRGVLWGNFGGTGYCTTEGPLVAPPFSVLFDVFYSEALAAKAFLSQGGSGGTGKGWYVRTPGGTPGSFGITFGGVADYTLSGEILTTDTLHTLCITVSGNDGTAKYYHNGAEISSVSVGTMLTPAAKRLTIGAYYSTAYGGFLTNSAIGNVLLFDRALTADEVAKLANNPWQIFEP